MFKVFVFFCGEIVFVLRVKVSIMIYVFYYGIVVFEGVWGNWNEK